MATTNDIDTKAAVRKFLEGRAVVDKEDKTADSADEIQTALESVALSFLLYPQAALSFVLKAKNTLQQIVATDLEILDYILDAISEIDNPDEPITDTSDLVEAQTALVEVDRLGRVSSDVRAYERYSQAVNRFLDKQLAKYLKRRRKNEFERTGTEAKQDLFRVLSAFAPTHQMMMDRLGMLLDSVSDFQSVSLTRIVSTRTLTRVRSSLNKVISAVTKDQISKTATALELLAGASALTSISNTRQVYDPTVDTGSYPVNRVISISSERVPATATGVGSTVDLGDINTPWIVNGVIDPEIGGTSFGVSLPAPGAGGLVWVVAPTGAQTYNITEDNKTFYIQLDGLPYPWPDAAYVLAVTLPVGPAVPLSSILSTLNIGFGGDATAVELGHTGRILITGFHNGERSVDKITVLSQFQGKFDPIGVFLPAAGPAHRALGFLDDQQSLPRNQFTPAQFADLMQANLTGATITTDNDNVIHFSSNSTELLSSLSFTGAVAAAFGFSGEYLAEPSYLELVENGVVLDPASLGIFIGSVVTTSDVAALPSKNLFAPITDIQGTRLLFGDVELPRCSAGDNTVVRIVSPSVFAVQSLLSAIRSSRNLYNNDARELQRVLSPLLSKPTLAQISDAQNSIGDIKENVADLQDALVNIVVRADRTEFDTVADQVTAALEDRGLDRALELLTSCQFSAFFALTSETASKGSRFLKASEEVGRTDLAQTTVEQDIDDLSPSGTTSDENLLPGEELSEDEEQV